MKAFQICWVKCLPICNYVFDFFEGYLEMGVTLIHLRNEAKSPDYKHSFKAARKKFGSNSSFPIIILARISVS